MSKNLLGVECPCGYKFGTQNIKPPFTKASPKFYGGRVKKFSQAKCDCGKLYRLYIRPIRQSWEVMDIEPLDEPDGVMDIEPPDELYEEIKFNDLRRIAKERGVSLPRNATREQIIELLG